MEKENYFSQRLEEERKRLKMSQDEVATLVGVSREMWGKYERGVAAPSVAKIIDFAKVGADVSYILTGVRSQPVEDSLSHREATVLDHYRNTDEVGRRAIEQTASALAQSAQKATGKKRA